ncbi:hypothetical protein V8C42DRAFT_292795 [Trichoderma barbatum]
MSANLIERTTRLHALDLQYQQNCHKTDLISRDEDARRLQLRVLLLRDENSQLQDKCAAKDAEIEALSRDGDRLRLEVDAVKAKNPPKDVQIKAKTIEAVDPISKSCETHMQDLSKALDDNRALTKELQQLRPEIELLRQQVTNYERMLSEQRGKELASNRQSKSKGSNDESDESDENIELRATLEKVTEKLAQEERQRESIKSNHQKELEKSERQNNKLEGRISTLEKKLKDSQRELRDMRKELKVSQSSSKGDGLEDENATHSEEATAPATQKSRRHKRPAEKAMIGEKSTFSITPLLNKAKDVTLNTENKTNGLGLTLDDVLAQPEGDNASPLVMANKSDAQPTSVPVAEQDTFTPLRPREKLKRKSKKKAAEEDEDYMANLAASVQNLGRVTAEDTKYEEILKTHDPEATATSKRVKLNENATADIGSGFESKKRKRKLLNKTNDIIIEEDETGEGAQPMEAQPGRTRRLKSSTTGSFNSQSGGKTFSPLKRHKRGVNASFLA